MHHFAIAVLFLAAVVVAGALGFAFRGAIGREIKLSEREAEDLARRLESGLATEVKAVAGEIRAKLAKL